MSGAGGLRELHAADETAQKASATTPRAATSAQANNESSLHSFRVKKGFRLESVATDALVSSPVAMAFDENGRLFVAEMRDFPNKQDQLPHLGRIRLLEDTDGDGVFDSSTVYADNLALPSAIACYHGGIFVASTPDILYVKDLNGDGISDTRKIAFSGFGGTNTIRSDHLISSFRWGWDNRIHGLAAGLGGVMAASSVSGTDLAPLGTDDFSFDGRSLNLTAEAGSGHSGLAFDLFGRRFISGNNRPLELTVLETRYVRRNPFFVAPEQTAPVIPTPARANTLSVESPVSPGNWLTQSRGTAIYRGNTFPIDYVNNVFIADPEAHVIRRIMLRENGLEVTATRPADEINREFISSSDPAFRPTEIINSPDGALYIADMQNGGDSGRIFRVVPENFKQPKIPQLAKVKALDLVSSMAAGNGWYQETASRLLYERHDPACVGLLTNMFINSRVPLVRLRALHALDGQGTLSEPIILKGLRDSDEHVREHALSCVEKLARNGPISDSLWNQVNLLGTDPSLRVRYQLTLSLGEMRRPEKMQLLRELLSQNFRNPWFPSAVLSSLGEGAGAFLIALVGDATWRSEPLRQQFLLDLATMIGTQGRLEEVTKVLNFLERARVEDTQAQLLLAALGEGLLRTGSSLALVDPQGKLRKFYEQTEEIILNEQAAEPNRVAALRLRSASPYTSSGTGEFLLFLLGARQSPLIQETAAATLSRYENANIPENIFARWPELGSAARSAAITSLLSRNDRVANVLAAVESGKARRGDFSANQINFLRTFPDPEISRRAVGIFGPFSARQPAVLEAFRGALRLPGSWARGRPIFAARCAACHGFSNGPHGPGYHLAITTNAKEPLLRAIVEPNAQSPLRGRASVALTRTGELWFGYLHSENKQTVTVQKLNGTEIILPQVNLAKIAEQPWSIMPEGLEKGLSHQDMADLIEYIISSPAEVRLTAEVSPVWSNAR